MKNLILVLLTLLPCYVRAVGPYTWTGASSSDWATPGNWLDASSASIIPPANDDAIFPASLSAPNNFVTLASPQSISTLTFNMATVSFHVGGFGGLTPGLTVLNSINQNSSQDVFINPNLSCGSTLTLNGSMLGRVFFNGNIFGSPAIVVNGADHYIGTGTAGGGLMLAGITVNGGILTVASSNNVNVTGPVVVNAGGTLRLCVWGGGYSVTAPSFTVNAGGTLKGTSAIIGPTSFASGAILAPGCSAGTMPIGGNLNLNSSTALDFELATPGIVGNSVNDLVFVDGNLQLGGVLNVTALPGFGAGIYRLFNYTGTLSGSAPTFGTMPPGYVYALSTVTAGQVNLLVSNVPPQTYTNAIPAGFSLIAIQLVKSNNAINVVLPGQDGDQLFGWDTVNQDFLNTDTYVGGLGWIDSITGDPSATTLPPGTGAFFYSGASRSIIITGTLPVPAMPLSLPRDTYHLVSAQFPGPASYQEIVGAPPGAGTKFIRFDRTTQDYNTNSFNGSSWSAGTPFAGLGESVFVYLSSGAPLMLDCPSNKTVTNIAAISFDTPTASGGCSNASVVVLSTVTNSYCPLSITRTWRATDICSNSAVCSQTVTASGGLTPTIDCPDNLVVSLAGSNTVPITYPSPTVMGGTLKGCNPPSGTALGVGTYYVTCLATNACGSNTCTFSVTVVSNSAPVITTQPQSVTVVQGQTATFSVTAVSLGGNLVYQWIFCPQPNWNFPTNILLGADAATLILSNVTDASAGSYFVIVSNVSGSVTSAVATLAVFPPLQIKCPTKLKPFETCSNVAQVLFHPSIIGGCGNVQIICNPPSGYYFPIGTTPVMCSATDSCGNYSSCSFNVTVVNNSHPTKVLSAGYVDALAPPTDPTFRSGCLNAAYPSAQWKDFDDTRSDHFLGQSFVQLPTGIVRAELMIQMKPLGGLSVNDALYLGLKQPCSPASWAWARGISTLPGAGGTWSVNPNTTFVLDLDNLPGGGSILAKIATDRFLDVMVQDDTVVDWMRLRIWTCPPKHHHFGLVHSEIGEAQLVATGDGIAIQSLSASGENGAAIEVGQPSVQTLNLHYQAPAEAGTVTVEGYAYVSGMGWLRTVQAVAEYSDSGYQGSYSFDVSTLGAATCTVRIYNGKQIVHEHTGSPPSFKWPWKRNKDKGFPLKPLPVEDFHLVPYILDENGNPINEGFKVTKGGELVAWDTGGGTSVEGDSMAIFPNNATVRPTSVSHANILLGGGLTELTIVDETLSGPSAEFQALGATLLEPWENNLSLRNTLPLPPPDWLKILLGRAEKFDIHLDTVDPNGTAPDGTVLNSSTFGSFNGETNHQIDHFTLTKQGADIVVAADFSSVGSTTHHVNVLSNGVPVASISGYTGTVIVPEWPSLIGKLGRFPDCRRVRWPKAVAIRIGALIVSGNELQVLAEGVAGTIDYLEQVTLGAQGAEELTVTSVDVTPIPTTPLITRPPFSIIPTSGFPARLTAEIQSDSPALFKWGVWCPPEDPNYPNCGCIPNQPWLRLCPTCPPPVLEFSNVTASCGAQYFVIASNAIGYATSQLATVTVLASYTINIHAGLNLIANQLDRGSNKLNEIMPVVPAGTRIFKFDNASQRYRMAAYDPANGIWISDPAEDLLLNPGEGAYLESPTNFTLRFVGVPHVPILPMALQAGRAYLLSRQTPTASTPEDIVGGALPPNARAYTYHGGYAAYTFDPDDLVWTPATPVAAIGEAMWILPAGGTLPAVLAAAPVITQQPQSLTLTQGQGATFSVAAIGLPQPAFQWRFTGSGSQVMVIPGATNSTYTIANAGTNNVGLYDVIVSNSSGSVTSAPAFFGFGVSIHCPPSMVVQSCGASAVVNYPIPSVSGGSLDYCFPAPGSAFSVGTTPVHCYASSGGFFSSHDECTFYITVQQIPPPTIACQDLTVVQSCGPNAAINYPAPSVYGGYLVGCSPPSGSPLPIGTTPVTCTAVNACATRTCTFNVTVIPDIIPPTLIALDVDCASNRICLTFSEAVNGSGIDVANYAVDSGAGPTILSAAFNGNAQTVCLTLAGPLTDGTHTMDIFGVSDLCGNIFDTGVVFTVYCPTNCVECPTNKTVECGTPWTFDLPTNTCTNASLVITELSTDTNGVCPRTITRMWSIIDSLGHSNACSQTVTVQDTTPPNIAQCATNRTLNLTTNCLATIPDMRGEIVAADGCGPVSITQEPISNSVGAGIYPVVFTVCDGCANCVRCTNWITVVGQTGPNLVFNGDFEMPVNSAFNSSEYHPASSVGWNTTDPYQVIEFWRGNAGSMSPQHLNQHLEINAISSNTIVSQVITNLDTNCTATFCFWYASRRNFADSRFEVELAGSGMPVLAFNPPPYTGTASWQPFCTNFIPASSTITIKFRATSTTGPGGAHIDNVSLTQCCPPPCLTPPVVTCPTNKIVDCSQAWSFDAPTFTTNCCATNLTISVLSTVTNGTCPRTFTRTWEAIDCFSNSTICTQVVTIVDTTPPIFGTGAGGGGPVLDEYFDPGYISFASGFTEDSAVGQTFKVATSGTLVRVDLWVSRSAAIVTRDLMVELRDTFAGEPDLVSPARASVTVPWTSIPASYGWQSFVFAVGAPVTTGETLAIVMRDPIGGTAPGSTYSFGGAWWPWGVYPDGDAYFTFLSPINWTPYGSGSYDYSFRTYLASPGGSDGCPSNKVVECGTPWTFDTPSAFDECCGTNVTLTFVTVTNGVCPQYITRTWTATDCCSNSTTCTQMVTVLDVTPPVINCPGPIKRTICGTSANVHYTAKATDDCDPSVPVVCVPPSGTLFNAGVTTVTCYATNDCGLTASCSFTVTVVDTSTSGMWQLFPAGIADCYAPKYETAVRSACLNTAYPTAQWKNFDDAKVNRVFGYSWNLPTATYSDGWLFTRMKDNQCSGGPLNDSINLGLQNCLTPSWAWSRRLGTDSPDPGLSGGYWCNIANCNHLFSLHLSALPKLPSGTISVIPQINSTFPRRFDMLVQDATMVDYANLWLRRCPPQHIIGGIETTLTNADLVYGPASWCLAKNPGATNMSATFEVGAANGVRLNFDGLRFAGAPRSSAIIVTPQPAWDYAVNAANDGGAIISSDEAVSIRLNQAPPGVTNLEVRTYSNDVLVASRFIDIEVGAELASFPASASLKKITVGKGGGISAFIDIWTEGELVITATPHPTLPSAAPIGSLTLTTEAFEQIGLGKPEVSIIDTVDGQHDDWFAAISGNAIGQVVNGQLALSSLDSTSPDAMGFDVRFCCAGEGGSQGGGGGSSGGGVPTNELRLTMETSFGQFAPMPSNATVRLITRGFHGGDPDTHCLLFLKLPDGWGITAASNGVSAPLVHAEVWSNGTNVLSVTNPVSVKVAELPRVYWPSTLWFVDADICHRLPYGRVIAIQINNVTYSGDELRVLTATATPLFSGVSVETVGAEGLVLSSLEIGHPSDSDGDGLPDSWELAHGLNPNDPFDALGDLDGDGMTNLGEYIAGTDPLTPGSVLSLQPVLMPGAGTMRLRFRVMPERIYEVQASSSLNGDWTTIQTIPPQPVEHTEEVVVPTTGQPARFFRARVIPER